jgi:hypothetical protein
MLPGYRRIVRGGLATAGLLAGAWACSSTSGPGPAPAPARSVLFIGNSLTYLNDLPALVKGVAEAAGDSLRVAMVAGPNLAVIDHVNGATDAVARIDGAEWGFVVLQQGPTPAGVCRDTLVLAAMRLGPHISAAGGRAAVVVPWARLAFPQSLGFADESAVAAARSVGGVVAPVGIAWKEALETDPAPPLYSSDGYHPAPAGSLLAALTIYDRLFGRDVRDIPAEALARLPVPGLTRLQLRVLAEAAHAASAARPADPPEPAPADTTRVSPGGGPC